jgi:HK97 family phage prohead protease
MKPELKRKLFEINDYKVSEENGKVVVSGYANTKNKPDRYGDVPTVFTSLRGFVYDLADFAKNPVMLIDHQNTVDHIAGSYVEVREDEIGLFVKGVFSNSDLPLIKHARTVYAEGHAKAFSIAGYWYFEDKDNPEHLTLAEICEISLVGVGADPDALGAATMEKRLADEKLKENADVKEIADMAAQAVVKVNEILNQM